jgi:hypothetical protein
VSPKKRPPLGLMRFDIWVEQRIQDILAAISRYIADGKPVPPVWRTELEGHLNWRAGGPKQKPAD